MAVRTCASSARRLSSREASSAPRSCSSSSVSPRAARSGCCPWGCRRSSFPPSRWTGFFGLAGSGSLAGCGCRCWRCCFGCSCCAHGSCALCVCSLAATAGAFAGAGRFALARSPRRFLACFSCASKMLTWHCLHRAPANVAPSLSWPHVPHSQNGRAAWNSLSARASRCDTEGAGVSGAYWVGRLALGGTGGGSTA